MTEGDTTAADYANRLLAELGRAERVTSAADHPALAWRRAGLMDVTGLAAGPGLVCPGALASAADGALLALKALAARPEALPANGALLLGERAQLMGLRRGGAVSANGSCRLVEMQNGRIALNLARDEDWDLIHAWLGEKIVRDWDELAAAARSQDARAAVVMGAELGLPVALDVPFAPVERVFSRLAPRMARRAAPVVVELASLWAGPLAGALLTACGADVIKVESLGRPDGARSGHPQFFDLLNGGKRSVVLDFTAPDGRAALLHLLRRADIIIEGSRPRALRQLGIQREELVREGAVWVSINAHGHDEENRVGFGDDAAVAAGLASIMEAGWGQAMFAGDAIADPLTGLLAALGAWAAWQSGGGSHVALSLRGSVAHALMAGVAGAATLRRWQGLAEADTLPLYALRPAPVPARPLGADTAEILPIC